MENAAAIRPYAQRYAALDGMRAIGAFAVAILHFDPALLPGAYLSVDLFFVLSGFILTRVYRQSLRDGLGSARMLVIRAIRLYPLHIAGVLFYCLYPLQGFARGKTGKLSLHEFLVSLPFNILMLPSPATGSLFPINGVGWSLFYELLASALFAAGWYRLGKPALLAVSICLAGLFVLATSLAPVDPGPYAHSAVGGGPRWSTTLIASLRCGFAFNTGMLVGLLPALGDGLSGSRVVGRLAPLSLIAVVAALAIVVPPSLHLGYDLVVVLLVWPLLVWIGSQTEPGPVLGRLCIRIGSLSYALYVIHLGVVTLLRLVSHRVTVLQAYEFPIFMAVSVALAWGLTRWMDEPVRRWLTTRVLGQPAKR